MRRVVRRAKQQPGIIRKKETVVALKGLFQPREIEGHKK